MDRKSLVATLLLMVFAGAAIAGGPAAVRKQVEASMLLTGTVDIASDGTVDGYDFVETAAVNADVRKLLARVVPAWRFEPVLVNGQPADVRAETSIRLVMNRTADDAYLMRIVGASFGSPEDGESPTSLSLAPPSYPRNLAMKGVGGTVYLALKIDRDGQVVDAVAEQVNLRTIASETSMQRYRDQLAQAALRAADQWTFRGPVAGPEVDAPHWSVRVPVDFLPPENSKPIEAGAWHAYVPGPRQPVPWASDDEQAEAADARLANGVYPLRSTGPQLLTSLDPS